MRVALAERLLVKIMEWNTEEISKRRPMLQALANFKYDEYQQFSPGIRFMESLVKWLNQFDTLEEKRIAYDFITNKLIFISSDQILITYIADELKPSQLMLHAKNCVFVKPLLLLSAIVCLLFSSHPCSAQKINKALLDSLLTQLPLVKRDTGNCRLYGELSAAYLLRDPIKANDYANKLLALAKRIHLKKGEATAYFCFGKIYMNRPDDSLALDEFKKCGEIAIKYGNLPLLALNYYKTAHVMSPKPVMTWR